MKIKSFFEYQNFSLISPKDENQRDIKLYDFQNVSFSGFSNYYPDVLLKQNNENNLILPLKEMTMSLNKKSYYEENGMEFNFIDNSKNLIKEPVYFFIYNTENYYHFIYDTLPYLYCYLKMNKVKLLMNFNQGKNKLLPFVKETLDLLEIKDIILHEEGNVYEKLFLQSSLTHNGLSNNPPRKEIFEIYDLLIKNALDENIKTIPKIYVSRRTWINGKNENIGTNYTLRRKLMNEDELVENLKEEGFEEVFGENFSMKEKINIFNKADIVIGAIGGTITNCVFSSKKTKIITLVSPDFLNINFRMKYLFNENCILFEDTKVYLEKGEIPMNVRIESNNGLIGEICDYENGKYKIKLAKNLIGFNEGEEYETIMLNKNEFKTLDNGLNSPWEVNINLLLSILNQNKDVNNTHF